MSAQEPPMPLIVADGFTNPHESSSGHRERRSISSSRSVFKVQGFKASVGLENMARRTLGIFLLCVTVFLWTASNFLASVR